MISAAVAAVGLVAQVVVGCAQLAFSTVKLSHKVGKGLAKGGWRAIKTGKKLGKGVIKVIRKSRVMARDNIPSPSVVKSHLFTEPTSAESVISKSRNASSQPKKNSDTNKKNAVTKSRIFNKNDK